MTSRAWLITINNPSDQEKALDFGHETWQSLVKLAVWQVERGEEGTPHVQGYIVLKEPRRLTWMKKRLPRAHLERRRGNHSQALQYVLKEQTREEGPHAYPSTVDVNSLMSGLTSPNTQTTSGGNSISKLQLMKISIDGGAKDLDLAEQDFDTWIKHYKGLAHYRMLKSRPRDHEVEVHVYQGPTGTGKSRYAKETYPEAYWKQRSMWWDGYLNHEVVILDEFYGWLPFDLLLRICDRYPMYVESKGGQINFVAKKIIITTNSLPERWYKNVYFKSFTRRVTEWHIFPIWGFHSIYCDYATACMHMINNE